MKKRIEEAIQLIKSPEGIKIASAQRTLEKFFHDAALKYMIDAHNKDLQEERKNWTTYNVTTDYRTTGKITVKQTHHDESGPYATKTWEINKKELLKKYGE